MWSFLRLLTTWPTSSLLVDEQQQTISRSTKRILANKYQTTSYRKYTKQNVRLAKTNKTWDHIYCIIQDLQKPSNKTSNTP